MFYDFLFKSKRPFVVKKFMSHANECTPFDCQWNSTEYAVTIHFALNWSELFQEPTFPLKRFRVRWTHLRFAEKKFQTTSRNHRLCVLVHISSNIGRRVIAIANSLTWIWFEPKELKDGISQQYIETQVKINWAFSMKPNVKEPAPAPASPTKKVTLVAKGGDEVNNFSALKIIASAKH